MSPTPSTTIQQFLEKRRQQVDEELDRLLPGAGEYPPSIHEAMRYSVFAGGKRIRPILCLETGLLLEADEAALLRPSCALELIHTYSLIHDDLPALDNDDLRRGKPTSHRAFGEATAILAGDALLTLAFEVLTAPAGVSAARQLRAIHELAAAIGTRGGMVGGQVADLEASGRLLDARTLEYIHAAKTGALIRAAVRMGAIYGHGSEDDLARVTAYGEKIGLAFQIADDLLDVTGSAEQLGKAVRKDGAQQKATYPGLHGVEESRRIASQLVREACESLAIYGERAQRLEAMAHFLVERDN